MEIKVKIADYKAAEANLIKLGAKFIKDQTHTYTYFNQPRDKVLKITKNDEGIFRTELKLKGDQFVFTKRQKLTKVEATELESDLKKKFGIKKRLTNHARLFELDGYLVSTDQIEGVGQFLIVMGDDPKISFITDKIGLKNPEIVTESFDNL